MCLNYRILAQCDGTQHVSTDEFIEILGAIGDFDEIGLDVEKPRGIAHDEIRHSTPLLEYQSYAAHAWLNFKTYFRHKRGGSLYVADSEAEPCIKVAALYVNRIVGQGFIPPIVLRIMAWLHTFKQRYRVDARSHKVFGLFRSAWRAYDASRAAQYRADAARREKIRWQEGRYRCATKGCGIQATHRSGLRSCGGNCPASIKPSYCSELCQRTVRGRCFSHFPIVESPLFRIGLFISKFVLEGQLRIP